MLVSVGGVVVPARADDPAAAEVLFREGRALLSDGKTEAACAKFKASQVAEASPGTLLNLAACHQALGKTATAWAEFVAAARLARAQRKDKQEAEATRRAGELEGTLVHLTLRVADSAPGLTVRRNDAVVEPSAYGTRIPVDPGRYSIDASAPGYVAVHLETQVGDNRGDVVLDVPKLQAEAGSGAAAAPKPARPDAASARVAPLPAPASASSSSSLPWVIGGLGGAFLVTGGVAGVLALRSNSSAKERCSDPSHCADAEARKLADRRDTQAMIANIGIGAGALGVGVAAVLLLTSKSTHEADAARLVPVVAPRHAGVIWTEQF